MSDSFIKIRRKHLLSAIIKALLIGLASGLGGVGTSFLVVTLGKFDLQWFYYLSIGLGVSVIVGAIVFFCEYKTEKEVAKKIDENFELKERVQTMVEFQNSDGDIAKMQRSDTDARLKSIAKKTLKFKDFLTSVIVFVVCLSIFVSGLTLSFAKKADAENPNTHTEQKFDYSQNRRNAMLELIENVKNSDLPEENRNTVAVRLEELHSYVSEAERTVLEVKTAIGIAVAYIDVELEGLTSYRELHAKLVKINTGLSDGIVASLNAYKQYSFQYTNYANVKSIYESMIQDDELLSEAKKYFEKTEKLLMQTENQDVTQALIKRAVENFSRDAKLYLNAEEKENDGKAKDENAKSQTLTDSFKLLVQQLDEYKDDINEFTDLAGVRAEIKDRFLTFYENYSLPIAEEVYPCMMQQLIRNKLCAIFQVSKNDLPLITPDPIFSDDATNPSDPDSGNTGDGGGGGTGESLYPSDDVIYDPDQAKYVKYGDILDEHEAKMQDTLMSSDLPEDIKKAILSYFQYIGTYKQKE